MNSIRAIAIALLLLFAASPAALAQATTGNITGVAKAGDTVVVAATRGGLEREITLEEDGQFNIRRRPLGEYRVFYRRADGTVTAPTVVRLNAGVTVRVQ